LNGIPSLQWWHFWSKIKIVLIAFVDIEGLDHHEFVARGHSMNQNVYKTVLQHLQDALHQKLPHKWFPVPGVFTSAMHFAQQP
jgi:hypothetical protein